MGTTLITVATDAGGVVTAVGAVGSFLTLGAEQTPEPLLLGLLTAGVLLLVLALVSGFEVQSRRWVNQMEAQARARRQHPRVAAVPYRSTTVHESGA